MLRLISILITLILMLPTLVGASSINIGDKIRWTSYNTLSNAGAFNFIDIDTGFEWTSFCLEKTVDIPNVSYVGGINDYVVSSNGTDPISDFTSWLILGAVKDNYLYDYDGSNKDSYDLQNLIWFNENEISKEVNYYNRYQVLRWKEDFLESGWHNTGTVKVLNTYKDSSFFQHAQDQLVVLVPTPEPSTLILVGFGFIGLLLTLPISKGNI